jgi:CheY-like chemotaxis protein
MSRILVIDDSDVIRGLLVDFLTEAGHVVETACDGEEGLDKAQKGEYDLCICDLHMPKKNGYQIFCELGTKKDTMHFVFTDSLPDELYENISKNTDHLCLRKPFDLDQVREALDKALAKVKTT